MTVALNDRINAAEGQSTTLTVDFDVDQNFVIQGGEGESAIRGVLFTPVRVSHHLCGARRSIVPEDFSIEQLGAVTLRGKAEPLELVGLA